MQVDYKINTSLNKKGLNELQQQLSKVKQEFSKVAAKNEVYTSAQAVQDKKRISEVQAALSKSYNSKLGVVSTKALNQNLGLTTAKAAELYKTFQRAGAAGNQAFASLIARTNTFQVASKNISSTWAKMQTTFMNTLRWGASSALIQGMTSSLMDAVSYVKELDESLTQITMVSGESRDNMKEFAAYANKAAASLGSSTTDYTNAVKVFIQEGFNLSESKEQATQATILANVSEQDTATTADQITAYRNAFGLSIEDMNSSLDKIAKIANTTAANTSELMTASQKAASTAASVGASEDSFLASIATIQSVTRESAENIGNGLKSIYTRFADVSMGESTDDDVDLGQYGQALKSAGVNILDNSGNLKSMDTILSELQSVWETLDDSKKVAVGEKVAGRYQYNRFATLMNNKEYYEKAYNATQTADGSMEQMQEDYMEGIEGKTQQMLTKIETLFTQIYNSGVIEKVVDGVGDFVDVLSNLFDNIDGGLSVVTALSAVFLKLGGKQLATGVVNGVNNLVTWNSNRKEYNAQRQQGIQTLKNKYGNSVDVMGSPELSESVRDYARGMLIKGDEEYTNKQSEILEKKFSLINEKDNLNAQTNSRTSNLIRKAQTSGVLDGLDSDKIKTVSSFDTLINKQESLKKLYASNAEELDHINTKLSETKKRSEEGKKLEKEKNELIEKQISYEKQLSSIEDEINNVRRESVNIIKEASKDTGEIQTGASQADRVVSSLLTLDEATGYSSSNLNTTKEASIFEAASITKRDVDEAQKKADELEEKESNTASKKSSATSSKLSESNESVKKSLKEATQATMTYAEAQDKLNTVQQKYETKQALQNSLRQVKKLLEENSEESQAFINRLKQMTDLDLKGLIDEIKSIQGALMNDSSLTGNMSQKLTSMMESIMGSQNLLPTSEVVDVEKTAAGLGSDLDDVDQKVQNTKDNLKQLKDEYDAAFDKSNGVQIAQQFAEIATSFTMIASSVQMTIEAINQFNEIYNDSSATAKEKTEALVNLAIQILTTVGMGIPSAISLAKAIQTLGASALVTGAEMEVAGAEGAAAGVAVQVAWGPIALAFAAIVAVIGVAVFAFYSISKATEEAAEKANKYNNELEGLENAAQAAATATTTLSTEVDNLKDSWDELTSLEDDLDGLTEGTDEWTAKVQELNLAVLDLIENYPELAAYMNNDNGVLSIDQEGYDTLIKQKQNDLLDSQNTETVLNAEKIRASANASLENFHNDYATQNSSKSSVGVDWSSLQKNNLLNKIQDYSADSILNIIEQYESASDKTDTEMYKMMRDEGVNEENANNNQVVKQFESVLKEFYSSKKTSDNYQLVGYDGKVTTRNLDVDKDTAESSMNEEMGLKEINVFGTNYGGIKTQNKEYAEKLLKNSYNYTDDNDVVHNRAEEALANIASLENGVDDLKDWSVNDDNTIQITKTDGTSQQLDITINDLIDTLIGLRAVEQARLEQEDQDKGIAELGGTSVDENGNIAVNGSVGTNLFNKGIIGKVKDEDNAYGYMNDAKALVEHMSIAGSLSPEEIENLTGIQVNDDGTIFEDNGNYNIDADKYTRFSETITTICEQLNSLGDSLEDLTDEAQDYASKLDDDYLENHTNVEDEDAFNSRVEEKAKNDDTYKSLKEGVTDSYEAAQKASTTENSGKNWVKTDDDGNKTYVSGNVYATADEGEAAGYHRTTAAEDAEHIYEQNVEALELYQEVLAKAEAAQLRCDKGVETLSDSYDDWVKVLDDSNASETDQINTLGEINDCIQDLTDIDDVDMNDLLGLKGIDQDKVVSWLKKIKSGGEEGAKALQELNNAAARVEANKIMDTYASNGNEDQMYASGDDAGDKEVVNKAAETGIAQGIKTQLTLDTDNAQISLTDALTTLQQQAAETDCNAELTMDNSSAVAALNQIIQKAGLTTDQVQALLGDMDVTFDTEYEDSEAGKVEQEDTKVTYTTTLPNFEYRLDAGSGNQNFIDNSGNTPHFLTGLKANLTATANDSQPTSTLTGSTEATDDSKAGKVRNIKNIKGKKGGNPTTKVVNAPSSGSTGGSSGGSGGSGSKSKKTKANNSGVGTGTKRNQTKAMKTNKVTSKLSKALTKLSGQQDKLYGKNQINNLKDLIKYQLKYVAALEKQYKVQAKELKRSKKNYVKSGASKNKKYKGYLNNLDEDGNLTTGYWTTAGKKSTNNGDKSITGYGYNIKSKLKFNKDDTINEASEEKIRIRLYNLQEKWRVKANKKGASDKTKERYEAYKEEYEQFISAVDNYNSKLEEVLETIDSIVDATDDVRESQENLISTYEELNDTLRSAEDNWRTINSVFQTIQSTDFRTVWGDISASLIDAQSEYNKYTEKVRQRREGKASGEVSTGTLLQNAMQNNADWLNNQNDYYNKKYKVGNKYYSISQAEVNKNKAAEKYESGKISTKAYNTAVETYNAVIKAAQAAGNYVGNETTLYEKLQNANDEITDIVSSMKDAADTMADTADSIADQVRSTFEDIVSDYDSLNSRIQTIMDIATITKGEEDLDSKGNLLSTQLQTLLGKSSALQKQLDTEVELSKQYLEVEGENSAKYEESLDQQQSLLDELASNTSDILSVVQSLLENTLSLSTNSFLKQLGIDSSSWMTMEWENQDNFDDGWYDNYEKSYQLQSLKNSYQDLLDDTSSLTLQKKITEQMNKQMKYLESKTELSEYDVEYAQKQLDILKAQIALEDAQNNKNKMKLRRDASGNYSYVYTADQEDVADKQQELLEAQNEAYELAKERLQDASQKIHDYVKQASEDLATIWETYSGEEAAKRSAAYLEQLQAYINKTASNINDANNGIRESTLKLNKTLTECFNNTTLEELATKIKNGTITLSDFGFVFQDEDKYITTMTNLGDKIDDLIEQLKKSVEEAGSSYKNNVSDTTSSIDTSGSTENATLVSLNQKIESAVKDVPAKLKDIYECLNNSYKILNVLQSTYLYKVTDSKGNSKYYTTAEGSELGISGSGKYSMNAKGQYSSNKNGSYTVDTISASDLSTDDKTVTTNSTTKNTYETTASDAKGTTTDTSTTYTDGKLKAEDAYTKLKGWKTWVEFTKSDKATGYTKNKGGKQKTLTGKWWLYDYSSNNGKGHHWELVDKKNQKKATHRWTSKTQIMKADKSRRSFDTGGYTGNWSDRGAQLDDKGGKLAVLHQKELVLNATDTANMLKMIEAERDWMTSLGVSTPKIDYSSLTKELNAKDEIQQRVQIDASFPNAENTTEIKQALLSLADNAYMYASRNR